MSLIPAFEIGALNAWILAIVFLLLVYIPVIILYDFNKKMGQGEHYGKVETFINIFFLGLMIFSIFLPLKLGTPWFYIGFLIYILGLFVVALAIISVASTPIGMTFTKGIYKYSRNPGYIGQIIVFAGIGIASASWLYLLLSVILVVLTCFLVAIEERITQEKLGVSYLEYVARTPRWLGIPKTVKSK